MKVFRMTFGTVIQHNPLLLAHNFPKTMEIHVHVGETPLDNIENLLSQFHT